MRDVNLPLRKAYYDALSVLSHNTSLLNVIDEMAPDLFTNGREFKYVVLSTQTDTDQRSKDCFIHNATFLVNVVYGVQGAGGKKTHDEIADLITQEICPLLSSDYLDLSSSNLKIVTTEKIGDTTQFLPNSTHKVWIRSLRFRHIISEL